MSSSLPVPFSGHQPTFWCQKITVSSSRSRSTRSSEDTRLPDFCVVSQKQIGPHSPDYFQIMKAKKCFLSPSHSPSSCFGIGVLRCFKDRKSYLINVFQKHWLINAFSQSKCNSTVNPLLSPPPPGRGGGFSISHKAEVGGA